MSPEKINSIQVLIVDDSFFMRKMLAEIFKESNGEITVLDTAQNGLEAVEKAKTLKPDVITLDVEMPHMDGLTALRKIMKNNPTPVVMLSSHTGKGTDVTIRALELGAIDCVGKPSGRVLTNLRPIQEELIEKIKMAALCKPRILKTVEDEKEIVTAAGGKKEKEAELESRPAQFIVAIGSSTGGPRALNEFFTHARRFPAAAFVIVQHISVGFTQALARRLGEVSKVAVKEAEEGEILMGGTAYIAPAGKHLTLQGTPGRFVATFNDLPPRLGVKPSADIMMTSVAKAAGKKCAGVVLTGMGRDGTAGLKDIVLVGGKTFAQDAESCVVYGMPKAAMESGSAQKQMPIPEMVNEINDLLARG
ncbi:MAG TPA: chemotaxis response regulator protein-glutamate methylesterase [bacterium]|nr:chemotaxis response regulator protein-glutamate methylesterase [bacterium]